MQLWYEILLGSNNIDAKCWQELFCVLKRYLGWRAEWHIHLCLEQGTIHYYINLPKALPSSLGLKEFLFKEVNPNLHIKPIVHHPKLDLRIDTLPLILHKLKSKSCIFCHIECHFRPLLQTTMTSCFLIGIHQGKHFSRRLVIPTPANLLSIDFGKNRHLRYKKIPKYLDSEKAFRIARSSNDDALLLLDTFPYHAGKYGIKIEDFDFAKHSLVIGSSGSGKSRFLSLLINRLYQNQPKEYRVVVIDPHDALKYDLGDIKQQRIIDFRDSGRSIDLFQQDIDNIGASVELMIETFRTLIGDSYNGRLERVLRHSIYLLLLDRAFNFSNLRRLLADVEFRNMTLLRLEEHLPTSVSHFFLTEFQELRSQSYDVAFAPIMAFIDEMQMIPVMNQKLQFNNMSDTIKQNFLTIFSLNRLLLGDKPTRVIAGLLMQQLFLFSESRAIAQHLIIVIDEVAVIENPILVRFLSEMRKYHVSVIIASQYFGQISANLRAGILANVSNYYIFRVSRSDAEVLSQNIQLKLIGDHVSFEDEQKLFTGLKTRECLVQLSHNGELYPLFKAYTPDYEPRPDQMTPIQPETHSEKITSTELSFTFSIDSDCTSELIMRQNSTNRKIIK